MVHRNSRRLYFESLNPMTADTPAASKDDERLIAAQIGTCTCGTKTPDPDFHTVHCPYAAAARAMDTIAKLRAHVATLTAQLEAERDLVASYRHTLLCTNEEKARETARADAAVAEAKALREVIARVEWGGLTQTGYDGDVTSCCPDPACNALINTEHSTDCAIRAALAQPADGGK